MQRPPLTQLDIREDDLTSPEVVRLLDEHLYEMRANTPPESVHALDHDSLRAPGVTFWSAWEAGELVGCGALKAFGNRDGEIKSMRTPAAHRGRGVASRILEHIISVARLRGYRGLYLETGSTPDFHAARVLYDRYGFEYRGPFGDYTEDPNSVYMVRKL